MSNLPNALERYSAAVGQLKAHAEFNKPVFDTHQQLVYKVMDAENDLRDAVAEAKTGISNGIHVVNYTPQTQTYADIETLDKMIGQMLTKEARDQIVKTVERPARVTIGEVKTNLKE